MARVVLFEDERGYLLMDGNELTVGSKIDDPPKVRLTSPIVNGGGGGCISFNSSPAGAIQFGSNQTEMALIRVEQAEDVRGTQNPKAEFNFLLNDGSGGNDSAMRKALSFVWNALTKLSFSLFSSRSDTIWAPGGLSFTQQQDDGNFVTYKVTAPFDKSASPRAVWSAWTGFIA